MDNLKNKFGEVDALIKAARWAEAQTILKSLSTSKELSRDYALPFAALCRRASMPEKGLTALRPYVRPTGRKRGTEATEAEINEYAAILIRVGACQEAHHLLKNVNSKSSTEVLHTLASLYVKQWNYPAAIPLFVEYTNRGDISSYSRQIGNLNLALCLTFEEKLGAAESLAQIVLNSKESAEHRLVKANALRLLGLIKFQETNYSESLKLLNQAFLEFPESNAIDRFLVQKWLGLVEYATKGDREEAGQKLMVLRQRALDLEHWESVRDIDYHTAIFDQNEQLLLKVYFGTPYERYRKRIVKRFPKLQIPKTYVWQTGKESEKKPKTNFDLLKSHLKPGQSIFRVLSILCSDFYRPFSVMDLFDRVLSDGFYSPGTSEQRIHQLLTRTRNWIDQNEAPIEIVSDQSRVTIKGVGSGILVHLGNAGEEQAYFRLDTIRTSLGDEFSVSEAQPLFDFSRRTLINLLTKSVEDGTLIRVGEGKKTRYRFSDSEIKEAA